MAPALGDGEFDNDDYYSLLNIRREVRHVWMLFGCVCVDILRSDFIVGLM